MVAGGEGDCCGVGVGLPGGAIGWVVRWDGLD